MDFEETEQSKIFPNKDFGYWKVTVERPLRIEGVDPEKKPSAKELKELKASGKRSESAPAVIKKIHGKEVMAIPLNGLFETTIDGRPAVVEYEPDTKLRDTEQIPLLHEGGIYAFLEKEVLPYAPDAWYSPEKVKVGYEISFTRHLLQAKVHEDAGGDTGGHTGTGTRVRRTTGGDSGEITSAIISGAP